MDPASRWRIPALDRSIPNGPQSRARGNRPVEWTKLALLVLEFG
jgi:hypothetical protein